jgi:hypothetical protein
MSRRLTAKCAICGAVVLTRKQWISELCPKQLSGKSMHALPAEHIPRLRG